jgi:two-component system sensor histidine kinase ChiS
MKTTRTILMIIGSFLLALTCLRLVWIMALAPTGQPQAASGVLDLRNWDFTSSRTVSLNGEWEFYPQQFLMDKNDSTSVAQKNKSMIAVPGKWNAYMQDAQKTFGYGTYRLRILVDSNQGQLYGIRIPNIASSSELFVNSQLMAQSGQPATHAEQYTARNVPYSVNFSSNEKEIEVIVQAANFHDRLGGGITWPVTFGSDRAVQKTLDFSIGMQLSVSLVLLLHAVYAVILYFMGVRHKALVYFTLLILCAILTILIDNSSLLLVWLPIPYDWTQRIYYWIYLGISSFIFHYTKHLLPEGTKIRGLRFYTYVCIIYALLIAVLPLNWLMASDFIHVPLVILPFLAVPALTFAYAVKGHRDLIFILLGISAITSNIIWGIVRNTQWMEMDYYPFDMIAAFLAFASYWFKRYLRSSDQTAKLAERLIQEDKLKDQFLVRTSHELRNPLHGMLNLAQTMLSSDSKHEDTQNQENMNLLIAVGKRMSYLVNDLLDITRLKEQRIELFMSDVQIQTLTSGLLDMIHMMAEGKPIKLVNNIPPNLPAVVADENRLIQILFNLLHNAVKFTDEGYVIIDAYTEGNRAFIQVSDTGRGIEPEAQQTIFDPYIQSGLDQAASASGLGLGLNICKQLVELHQSSISVTSTPGYGATFTFSLLISPSAGAQKDMAAPKSVIVPTVRTEIAAAQHTSAHGGHAGEDPTLSDGRPKLKSVKRTLDGDESTLGTDRPQLLAIEDDPVNLNILKSVLRLEGYAIVTATSGKEALSLLPSREWDLIISDVMMPHMSGYELARTIRERFSLSELPILLLTARSRPEDIEAGFQAGANDYLTKPVDATELKSRVRALTDNKKSARERLHMEAAWLQAQIQPHFLFNTLNSISALSLIDIPRMRLMLDVFSEYLRASFQFRNAEQLVPLAHELDLVRSYLYIEQERFGDRLLVDWTVDDSLSGLMIPPLTIQPLVENAVRNGLLPAASGGKIRIRILSQKRSCRSIHLRRWSGNE